MLILNYLETNQRVNYESWGRVGVIIGRVTFISTELYFYTEHLLEQSNVEIQPFKTQQTSCDIYELSEMFRPCLGSSSGIN